MVHYKAYPSRAEWLEARTSCIGGSDAACCVGCNPYKSNTDLYREKAGIIKPVDISGKDYVQYGIHAEEHLRNLFELDFPEYGLSYEENNMWTNDKYPWAHASLDGWLEDKDGRFGVWECKTTEITSSMQKEKWNDRIPDNYFCQLLHYMAVTEAEFAVLKAQLKYKKDGDTMLITKHYKIEADDYQEDIKMLMEAEKNFWECVKAGREPDLVLPVI